jgi:phospholipid/cholesterol/gamma-HCH transport system substrate-binding protein
MGEIPYRMRVVAGLIGVVLVGAVVAFVIQYSNGALAGGYKVKAVFDRAGQGLYDGNDVKVRGVAVGSVSSIGLSHTGQAIVTLHLNPGAKIPDTASASVQALSVFGPKYVDVAPGAHEDKGPFLRPGATITNTASATELFDVFQQASNLFNAVSPQDLSTVIQTFGNGLDGLGGKIGQTIDSSKVVADASRAEIPNVQALLSNVAQLTGVLAQRGSQLVTTAQNFNQILPDIASRPDQISSLLDQTSQVSNNLAVILEGHQAGLDNVLNGLSAATAGALFPHMAQLQPFVTGLSTFFRLLSGIVRLKTDRPDKLVGMVKGYLPGLCTLLTGVCAPGVP